MGGRQSGFVRMGFRRAGQAGGGGGGAISLVQGSAPIHVTGGSGPTVTVSHDLSGVAANTYAFPSSATVDATGHITAMTPGAAPVASVAVTAPITNTGTATNPNLGHAASGVAANTYAFPSSVTVNGTGHITAMTPGAAPVAAVAVTAPITDTGTATNPNLGHANSGLGAATIAYPASITFDAKGHPTAATPGTAPITTVLMSQTYNQQVLTIPFAANAYKKIEVTFDTDGGGISQIAMTGLSNATYDTAWGAAGSPGSVVGGGNNAANFWVTNISGTRTTARLTFSTPPAPAKKAMTGQGTYLFSGNIWSISVSGDNTDTTHDPTAIVITLDAIRSGYIYAVGYV